MAKSDKLTKEQFVTLAGEVRTIVDKEQRIPSPGAPTSDEELQKAIATIISGAPFPSSRSLKKANEVLTLFTTHQQALVQQENEAWTRALQHMRLEYENQLKTNPHAKEVLSFINALTNLYVHERTKLAAVRKEME